MRNMKILLEVIFALIATAIHVAIWKLVGFEYSVLGGIGHILTKLYIDR